MSAPERIWNLQPEGKFSNFCSDAPFSPEDQAVEYLSPDAVKKLLADAFLAGANAGSSYNGHLGPFGWRDYIEKTYAEFLKSKEKI